MFIPLVLKINDSNSRILMHDKINSDNDIEFIKRKLRRLKINEGVVSRVVNNYKLMSNNYCSAAAGAVKFYSKSPAFRSEFFGGLYKFIKQFYSKDEEVKKISDPTSLYRTFTKYHKDFEEYLKKYKKKLGLGIRVCWKKLNKVFDFYSIIEDYLIRYYGYSVIGIGGCKYIITSQSDCYKRFENQLMNGYKLIRLQKIYLKESNRYYGFVPALPTGDIGIPVDEFIEPSGRRNIIRTRKLLPVVKPREGLD